MSSDAPIGVFDSGVGGLSVLREIRRALPHENLLYVADSANAPYGGKDIDWLVARSAALVQFLLAEGAKAIVVACNTATSVAVETLRSGFSTPIIAIEPAVRPAVLQTRSRTIGVLATSTTLASAKFSALVAKFEHEATVLLQPCPGLVQRVEDGELCSEETRALVASYVQPLVARGADVLVLGCTHYPFLAALIQDIAGPAVTLVDPAAAVSRELQRRLAQSDLLSRRESRGREMFWTSAPAERTRDIIASLWNAPIVMGALAQT